MESPNFIIYLLDKETTALAANLGLLPTIAFLFIEFEYEHNTIN